MLRCFPFELGLAEHVEADVRENHMVNFTGVAPEVAPCPSRDLQNLSQAVSAMRLWFCIFGEAEHGQAKARPLRPTREAQVDQGGICLENSGLRKRETTTCRMKLSIRWARALSHLMGTASVRCRQILTSQTLTLYQSDCQRRRRPA